MTMFLALCVAVGTAWIIDWGQRYCENWCYQRDKDL